MHINGGTYSAVQRENTLELQLEGEIDLFTAGELQGQMLDEIARVNPASIDVDLTDVVFLDSAGLGMLLHLHNAKVADGNLRVIARDGTQVARVLRMGKFDAVFPIAYV